MALTLQQQITNEVASRKNADATLKTAQVTGDAANATAIAKEATDRAAADLALSQRMDALEARIKALEPVTPPAPTLTISGVAVSAITQTSATVAWNVSDFATGQVEYGTTTAYGKTTTLEPSFTYNAHSQTITGLVAGTLYHFRCNSKDQAGHTASSPDGTFTTLSVAAPPAPTNLTLTAGDKKVTAGWQ